MFSLLINALFLLNGQRILNKIVSTLQLELSGTLVLSDDNTEDVQFLIAYVVMEECS
jgi:hypothetical protein